MKWVEAFHVIFVVTWFAGLFYLPRLFVYAAENPDEQTLSLLRTMQRRLMGITHIGAALAVIFGLTKLVANPGYLQDGLWMHIKLLLVAGLVGYHIWCRQLVEAFARGRNRHSSKWYRWFNEVPALFLVAIVILVVVKPI